MRITVLAAFIGATAILGTAGGALADASLSQTRGQVLVNTGTGFLPASGQTLKPGDRVMIGNKSSARITFSDGCSLPMGSGVATIPRLSPCKSKAQQVSGNALRQLLSNPWIVGGIIGAAVAIPVAIHNSRSNDKTYTSP